MNKHSKAQQHKTAPTFTPLRGGTLQRKCACGQHTVTGGECTGCRKKRLSLHRRAASQAEPTNAPSIVNEVLRSSGRPLDPTTCAFMEPRFGHDFSRVPVHTAVPMMIQPKLTIGRPDDKYEQEADRVAEQVMRMPNPTIQPKPT